MGMNINGPMLREGWRPAERLREMARSGVESLRIPLHWDELQPVESFDALPSIWHGNYTNVAGVPTQFKDLDRVVLAAAAVRMPVLPAVLRAPVWARERRNNVASPPADNADYANLMTGLVQRYGPGGTLWRENPRVQPLPIRRWQIWNEANLKAFWSEQPFTRSFLPLLRAARTAVKRADPRAKIVLGGLVGKSWISLDKFYDGGARGSFDELALHTYTGRPRDVLRIVDRVRRRMQRSGDGRVPILLTELTWTSARGGTPAGTHPWDVTPAQQASRVREIYTLLARNRRRYNIRETYWFLWSSPDRGRTPFDWAGLLTESVSGLQPKPAFYEFERMTRLLEGCRKLNVVRCR